MPAAPDDSARLQPVIDALRARFGEAVREASLSGDGLVVRTGAAGLKAMISFLKSEMGFHSLTDIVALDLLKTAPPGGARFAVHYWLYRFPAGLRVRVEVETGEDETLDSIASIYPPADWAEREVFDLFGIRFAGHPDLRRIYLPDDFEGFPLRKDFPLRGTGNGL